MDGQQSARVLMIIGLYHPIVGGAEKVCQALSKGFSARGMRVTILTQHRRGLPDYEIIDGISVHRKMKWWHPFGIAYMISVMLFLVHYRRHYDVIQCFGLFLFIPPALLMKYLFKKKIVVRLLCSGPHGDFANIEELRCRRLIKLCAQHSDRIIYMSEEMKEELLQRRFQKGRLAFIPNGVDAGRFLPSETPADHVCYVGRLETQKGLVYLLRAFSNIVQNGCSAKLFVVGDGRQRSQLEDLSRNLAIDNQVIFTGLAEDVLRYYQQASVFVLPSLSEGMSSALLEAMSCGLAVVTTRVGAGEELVGALLTGNDLPQGHCHIGTRGIVINSHDEKGLAEALSLLLEDTRLTRSLGDRAREFVMQCCSHESMITDYQRLYHSLG